VLHQVGVQFDLLEIDLDRQHFTRHGQHLNLSGKEITALKLAMIIGQFYKRYQLASINIPWKDRSVEEGWKSPIQESD
jgi:DNA-binding response OmpR family regulator